MKLRIFTLSLWLVVGALGAEDGMTFVPGGVYQRGRTHALPDDGLKWYPEVMKDDRPVKAIRVDAFYMDTHEVTNLQYAAFVQATKHRAPFHWPKGAVPEGKEKFPVVNVSWEDAAAYARWAGKRLPTEAEWEHAARGKAEGLTYPWGNAKATEKLARFGTIAGPVAVGQYPANAYGLYDMAGNVWEWVADWYDREYYAKSPDANPKGPAEGKYKVMRGGSWSDVDKYLTCAYRSWARVGERSPNIGFRCVRSVSGR